MLHFGQNSTQPSTRSTSLQTLSVSLAPKKSKCTNLTRTKLFFSGKIEADDANLALVFHYFGLLLQHFEGDRIIYPKVKKRWDFIRKDAHGLAYLLTPKFAMNGYFFETKLGIICSIRDFVLRRGLQEADDTEAELNTFLNDLAMLPPEQKVSVSRMTAEQFWNIIGKEKYPRLYKCAASLNSMICSSGSAERCWSIFGFIHDALRNRLSSERVEKLVFLYVNAGILDEIDKTDYIYDQCAFFATEDFNDE